MEQTQQPMMKVNGWALALDRAPIFLSVLFIAILPFLTQTEGADPIHPKLALAQVMVALILAAWTLKVSLTGRVVLVWTNAFLPLLALVAWIALSIHLSPYYKVGWTALMDGACFPIWYLLVTLVCFELWKAENILIVFLVSALVTALWAVLQAFGAGGGVWLQIVQEQFHGRVTAGLGNPDFLAGYLLMVWPIALALYFKAAQPSTKILWLSLTLVSFLALIWTGSKAGIIGFYAGLLVFLFFFLFKGMDRDKLRKNKVYLIIGGLCLAGLLTLSAGRVAVELKNPQGQSIKFRQEVWKGTVEMIKDHPIMGVGFGAFGTAFPPYRPLSLMMWQTERSYEVNHAHNWILEWTAETGVVGLALLLLFGWYVLSQWWRLYSAKAIPRALGAGAFALFAGVAVDNLFDLNSFLPSTLVPLLFFAAMPVGLSQRFYHLAGFPIRCRLFDVTKWKVFILPFAATIALLSLMQLSWSFQSQGADVELKTAEKLSEAGKWEDAIWAYSQVLTLEPENLTARYFQGSAYANRGQAGDLELALADFQAVGKNAPDYVLLHYKKADVLEKLNRLDEASAEMKRAVSLDPVLVFRLPEYQKARKLADLKKYPDALPVYQKLVLDYPTCVPTLVDEANCLVMSRRAPEAAGLYKRVLDLDPENKEALANLKSLEAANQHL